MKILESCSLDNTICEVASLEGYTHISFNDRLYRIIVAQDSYDWEPDAVLSVGSLITCIQNSTRSMDIHVPSNDYYARHGDCTTEEITFVDATYLLQELEGLK